MWVKQVLLAILGLSAGAGVASGLFATIVGLGIVSDFADRTHTGKYVTLYEDFIILGGILGNIFWVYKVSLPYCQWFLPIFGLGSGIFVGCWSMALAEALNIFPVLLRRLKLASHVSWLILALAFGKGIGSLIYFINRW